MHTPSQVAFDTLANDFLGIEDAEPVDLVRVDRRGESSVIMKGVQIREPVDKLLLIDEEGRIFLSERVTRGERHEVLQVLLEDGTWR